MDRPVLVVFFWSRYNSYVNWPAVNGDLFTNSQVVVHILTINTKRACGGQGGG